MESVVKMGGLIEADKLIFEDKSIDLGHVGSVKKINPEIVLNLIKGGYIPVISPVGSSKEGDTYNINADTVAGKLAVSLKAEKLIFLTDVDGVWSDPSNEKTRVSSLTVNEVKSWIGEGKIKGGMVPKVEACIEAVTCGVNRTHILNGLIPHALLLEIFTDRGIGTMILKER